MKTKRMFFAGVAMLACSAMMAQSRLYPQLFDLTDVELTDGTFKTAMMLNDSVLLEYDAGRLMQPFEHQAGVKESGAAFRNWTGLDGHVGGHYITALAVSYASCRDEAMKQRLGERLDWCLGRLKAVQDKWNADADSRMHGYIGGVPGSREFFTRYASGEVDVVWKWWVPFYNIHKIYAGLRDAWLYAGREDARTMFIGLCDWGVNLIVGLTDGQIESSLNQEYGGMNEVFADAYQMTGDAKYLDAARKFSHKWLLNGMAARKASTIDNKHANTQVPKVVGFERVYQLDHSAEYGEAARFFWSDVAGERTIAVGGNSINEWFPTAKKYANFITSVEGVESCNSYNMLKLSEDIFLSDHDSRYADFYEGTLFNHILSTQHPRTGGYVYFTPARPQHYRVYSRVNEAMWCCVGSGMENHGKYGEFIYSHSAANDSLWVNLFIASRLDWKARKTVIEQATAFPYTPSTELTVKGKGKFTLLVRIPKWTDGRFAMTVNGEKAVYEVCKGYAAITRKWKRGDMVKVDLPMSVRIEPLNNYTDYVAFKYGPILLGAKTGQDNLRGLHADDSRMGHIAAGERKNIYTAPMLIGERDRLAAAVRPLDKNRLTFTIEGYDIENRGAEPLVLQPFSTIHDSRYMMYWLNVDHKKWHRMQAESKAREDSIQALEARTVDYIITGTQQSEADHFMKQENTRHGSFNDEYYRRAEDGFFVYSMNPGAENDDTPRMLMLRYWGGDRGTVTVDIDGQTVCTLDAKGGKEGFVNVEYPIDGALLKGKKRVDVRLSSDGKGLSVYYVRITKK